MRPRLSHFRPRSTAREVGPSFIERRNPEREKPAGYPEGGGAGFCARFGSSLSYSSSLERGRGSARERGSHNAASLLDLPGIEAGSLLLRELEGDSRPLGYVLGGGGSAWSPALSPERGSVLASTVTNSPIFSSGIPSVSKSGKTTSAFSYSSKAFNMWRPTQSRAPAWCHRCLMSLGFGLLDHLASFLADVAPSEHVEPWNGGRRIGRRCARRCPSSSSAVPSPYAPASALERAAGLERRPEQRGPQGAHPPRPPSAG
jgi:hypothetical protein